MADATAAAVFALTAATAAATAADAATFTERTTAASVETNGSEDEMSLGSVFARGFGADGAALSFRKRLLFDFPFPACELIA
jgi:hypothetical protein